MRQTIARGRALVRAAELECARARRNLADAAPPLRRRCEKCGGLLSRYAAPRDRYCAPCEPKLGAGALLAGARWGHAGDAHDAAVALGAKGGKGRVKR